MLPHSLLIRIFERRIAACDTGLIQEVPIAMLTEHSVIIRRVSSRSNTSRVRILAVRLLFLQADCSISTSGPSPDVTSWQHSPVAASIIR